MSKGKSDTDERVGKIVGTDLDDELEEEFVVVCRFCEPDNPNADPWVAVIEGFQSLAHMIDELFGRVEALEECLKNKDES